MVSEHIWPVTVKAKGLSGSRDKGIPPGSYRLCLTNTDVSLIRLYSDKPDVVVPVSISVSLLPALSLSPYVYCQVKGDHSIRYSSVGWMFLICTVACR